VIGPGRGLTKNDSSVQLDQGENQPKPEIPIRIFENPWPEEVEKAGEGSPETAEKAGEGVLETKESEKPQESPKFRFSKAKQKICGFGGKVQRKMILGKLNLNVALRK